jgi:pyruvate kinase
MLACGVTAFRLNTSHLTLAELADWLEHLESFLAAYDPKPAVILDLQGSKWRLGTIAVLSLIAGQQIELVLQADSQTPTILPVPHPDFFLAAPLSSGEIVLNDARVRLAVERIDEQRIQARVLQGGEVSARKGITFTASNYRQEQLSERDRAILAQTSGLDFVRYAISYVRDAAEMKKYQANLGKRPLIAKLERGPALAEANLIAQIAGEVWLCRGDLGAELGLKGMAAAVARFTEQVKELRAPTMLAGQVLEYMTQRPTPTRSEICYLYDALGKGYCGLVLSDETAVGKYPLEACRAAALFLE